MFYHIFRFASGRKIYFSLSSSLCRLRPSATFAPLSPLPLCRRGGRHTFGKPQKYAKAFQRGGEKSAFYSWVFRPLFGFSPMVAQENLLGCRPLSAPPEKALYFLRAYTGRFVFVREYFTSRARGRLLCMFFVGSYRRGDRLSLMIN